MSAGPDDRYSGFRALWAKVIIRAILDWVNYRDSTKLQQMKMAEQAYTWLFKPSELFNGFENVCKMLDIDPDYVREQAKKVTKDDVAKIEHIDRVEHPSLEMLGAGAEPEAVDHEGV